jgi:hypothetical protein
VLIPFLYLKGITGDFEGALIVLLGKDVDDWNTRGTDCGC